MRNPPTRCSAAPNFSSVCSSLETTTSSCGGTMVTPVRKTRVLGTIAPPRRQGRRIALRGWARILLQPLYSASPWAFSPRTLFRRASRGPPLPPHEPVIVGKSLRLWRSSSQRKRGSRLSRDSENGSWQILISVGILAQPLRLSAIRANCGSMASAEALSLAGAKRAARRPTDARFSLPRRARRRRGSGARWSDVVSLLRAAGR